MKVGQVQETITVSGQTPVVDVQTSTSREQVLSNETVQALPASRGYGNYLAAIPGIQGTGLSSSATPANPLFASRGGRSSEGNMQIDGMNVGSSVGGGGVSGYYYDLNNAAEVQVTIAGGLAEVDRGGPAINIVPKTGGNAFSGTYFGSFAGEWAQGSNIDDELRSYGFTDLPAFISNRDQSFSISGPVVRNRLWFFGNVRQRSPIRTSRTCTPTRTRTARTTGITRRTRASRSATRTRRSLARPAHLAGHTAQQAGFLHRLHQELHRFVVHAGRAVNAVQPGDGWTAAGPGIGPGVATTSPESATILDARSKIMQATYSAPLSSRILVEGGFSSFWTEWGDIRPAGAKTDQIAVTEQTTRVNTPFQTPFTNFTYHGWPATSGTIQQNANYRGSAVLRHRFAQREGRLPGRVHDREDARRSWDSRSAIASATVSRTS